MAGAFAWLMALSNFQSSPCAQHARNPPHRIHPPCKGFTLHVYAIEDGRCVPVWRGTRLAGRFDRIAVDGDRVLALERVGIGRRVAWYRWHCFGYRLEETLWKGRGNPEPRLMAMFEEGKKK